MTKNKIILVPFPFDDLSSSKLRPAACLTDPISPNKHVIVAFITSKVTAVPLSTDIIINATDSDFSVTGLRVSSTLRLHRLTTVTTSIIKRELGQMSPRLRDQIRSCLLKLFTQETDAAQQFKCSGRLRVVGVEFKVICRR